MDDGNTAAFWCEVGRASEGLASGVILRLSAQEEEWVRGLLGLLGSRIDELVNMPSPGCSKYEDSIGNSLLRRL